MRLTGGIFRHHGEDYLTGRKIFQAFFAGDELALGRKDGRNPNQILRRYPGIAQSHFERGEPFFVLPDALGQKQTLRDHAFAQC
jgi:hypothetical protein